jgi:uroporphyrin-III C-methyltransferase/precorrin-2 dehydrogenase/sirohydrochlorin ferrochelatase
MSAGSVTETVEQLIEHGLVAETPVAIVENGTTDQQRVLRGTLATIADDAGEAHINAPAVIIVGATAGMGEELGWFAADPDSPRLSTNQVFSRHRDMPILNGSTFAQ